MLRKSHRLDPPVADATLFVTFLQMDHINAATVLHRMGCIAVCYSDKSWILDGYKDIIVDFANFLNQPEKVDILELRQAVMCFWGLATMGPEMMDLNLSQSSDVRVRDCMRKLEAQMRTCDVSVRNGNNVCNVIEASALAKIPLEQDTLDYLLTGLCGLSRKGAALLFLHNGLTMFWKPDCACI